MSITSGKVGFSCLGKVAPCNLVLKRVYNNAAFALLACKGDAVKAAVTLEVLFQRAKRCCQCFCKIDRSLQPLHRLSPGDWITHSSKYKKKVFTGNLQWQLFSKSSWTAKQNARGHSVSGRLAKSDSHKLSQLQLVCSSFVKSVCTETASAPTCPQTLKVYEREK